MFRQRNGERFSFPEQEASLRGRRNSSFLSERRLKNTGSIVISGKKETYTLFILKVKKAKTEQRNWKKTRITKSNFIYRMYREGEIKKRVTYSSLASLVEN
jgi:hypothetical protein